MHRIIPGSIPIGHGSHEPPPATRGRARRLGAGGVVGVAALVGMVLSLLPLSAAKIAPPSATAIREYCQFDPFEADCESSQVVIMEHGRYGRIKGGRCISGEGYIGCDSDVVSYMDTLCSGKRHCSVAVTSLAEIVQPCKRDFTSYLEASYSCLPVATPEPNVCRFNRKATISAPSGTLASITTTEHAIGSRNCPYELVTDLGQRFELFISVFSPADPSVVGSASALSPAVAPGIANGVSGCPWNIVLEEKGTQKTESLCQLSRSTGKRRHFFTSGKNRLQVSFSLQGKSEDVPAFIVQYQAVGCPDMKFPKEATVKRTGDDLVIRCNVTRETWYLTCRENKWVGELGNCSTRATAGFQKIYGISVPFPQGLIVAIILGVLLGVVIGTTALGILLFARKRKRRRQAREAAAVMGDPTSLLQEPGSVADSLASYKRTPSSTGRDGSGYHSKGLSNTTYHSTEPAALAGGGGGGGGGIVGSAATSGKYAASKSPYYPVVPPHAEYEPSSGVPNTGSGVNPRRGHVYETPKIPGEGTGSEGKVYFELDPNDELRHSNRKST